VDAGGGGGGGGWPNVFGRGRGRGGREGGGGKGVAPIIRAAVADVEGNSEELALCDLAVEKAGGRGGSSSAFTIRRCGSARGATAVDVG